MTAALKDEGPQPKPKRKRAPKKVVQALPSPEQVEAQAKSPYPEGVRYFSYQPKGGGKPIHLAINGFESPDKLWLFDIAQLPFLAQTWQWMQRANIPKAIQRQAQMLPDAEYFEMLDEWFDIMKAGKAPKGAVTSGK